MSRYHQSFRFLRCKTCYDKAFMRGGIDRALREGRNVQAVRAVGDGVECKCLNCGHVSIRYSRVARRELASELKAATNQTETT